MARELPKAEVLEQRVFSIENEQEFLQIALDVYNFQFENNTVYRSFCELVHKTPDAVNSLKELPFLPIAFFKSREVKCLDFHPETVFRSSGTTGAATSRHLVKSIELYEHSFHLAFQRFFGDVKEYCVLGLLPSYLERDDSSLIYMVNKLITESGHPDSGFYLYDHERLAQTLQRMMASGQKTVLFGVSYALLDFSESHKMDLSGFTIIETGGMKGRREELSKEELYQRLKNAFGVSTIYSEYGMTELLSQAYAADGSYSCPPWMKVVLRDATDPFLYGVSSGAINVIDLANLYSCSFIATDDLGKMHTSGSFEVLGRLDNSDVRGCSQLVV